MTKLPAKLRLGKRLEGDSDELQKQLDDIYLDVAPAVNRKPDIILRDTAPTSTDTNMDVGTFWFDTTGSTLYILEDSTPTWTAI
jgi:hypothetical protein